jgi:tRNA threonylcarbamoyl adenosine modification protein YeaZ
VTGTPGSTRSAGGPVLAFDTATTVAVVALGTTDGVLLGASAWTAGHRHGEELLGRIDALLAEAGVGLAELGAIAVGTGPGAFTGLRVGLATAKGLAHGLAVPIVGVATANALLAAVTDDLGAALLMPAGPRERVLVRAGSAGLLAHGAEPDLPVGTTLVAVDLPGRAPAAAIALGEQARTGFAAALVRLAAERLRSGATDDLAGLVPEYVSLPRGVTATGGAVEWSRGPG